MFRTKKEAKAIITISLVDVFSDTVEIWADWGDRRRNRFAILSPKGLKLLKLPTDLPLPRDKNNCLAIYSELNQDEA